MLRQVAAHYRVYPVYHFDPPPECLVRHEHTDPPLRPRFNHRSKVPGDARGKSQAWLVQKDHANLAYERPGQGKHLLLTAGEVACRDSQANLKPIAELRRQKRKGTLHALLPAYAEVVGNDSEIIHDAQGWIDLASLGYEPYSPMPAVARFHVEERQVSETGRTLDRAAGRAGGDCLEQAALTGGVRSDHSNHFPLPEIQRGAPHRHDLTVTDDKVLDHKGLLRHFRSILYQNMPSGRGGSKIPRSVGRTL